MSRLITRIIFGAAAVLSLFALYLVAGPDSHTVALLKRNEAEGLVATSKVIEKFTEEYLTYENNGSGPRRPSLARAVRLIRDHNHRDENATVNYVYFVEVEFKDQQGKAFRTKETVSSDDFDLIKIGEMTPILYHPENPAEVNRLKEYSYPYRDPSELYRIMAMFTMAIVLMLLVYGLKRHLTTAAPIEATVPRTRMESARTVRTVASQPIPRRTTSPRSSAAPREFGSSARTTRT